MLSSGIVSIVRQLEVPWWVLYIFGPALLYYISIEAVLELRWFFQGLRYNVSLASSWGDVALGAFAFIAVYQIRQGARNGLLDSGKWHLAVAAFWILAGLIMFITGEKEVGDVYHNVLVLPLLGYLVVSMAPVLLEMSWKMRLIEVALLLVWVVLIAYDIKTGRLDQKGWIRIHWGLNV